VAYCSTLRYSYPAVLSELPDCTSTPPNTTAWLYLYTHALADCSLSTVCLLSTVYFLLPTAYCLLSTVYCLLPTVYCLLPTVYCLLPTAYCLLSTAYCLLPTVYCLLSTVYCLLPTAYCLLPTVYCLLSTVYCLLSTVYCLLSTVYCLLSTVHCLLSTVQCLLHQYFASKSDFRLRLFLRYFQPTKTGSSPETASVLTKRIAACGSTKTPVCRFQTPLNKLSPPFAHHITSHRTAP